MFKSSEGKSFIHQIRYLLIRIIILIASLLILFNFVIGVATIPDLSMEPVLGAGDIVIFFRLDKKFKSGDIVVYSDGDTVRTGRVAAVGGDTVEIIDNVLYINENLILENDIYFEMTTVDSDVEYPLQLDEDELFILCDRRGAEKDSRILGAIKTIDIKGKLFAAVRKAGF